jgi:hypothetical protein
MVASQAQQQLYTHAAEPKAVQSGQQRRAKYRDEEPELIGNNIMFDRRVVRGNTYAARILPADLTQTEKKSSSSNKRRTSKPPPRTPEPVDGRKHIDIQTDTYLEELTDTVPEVDNNTQTDAFLDRPPTPLFVPQKTGMDATTQIENGDLFDFDFEVEPVLEVLVGKVLEQGLMEVLEEEELAAMRAHQEHFEQIRNSELVATQRMEAAEKRKLEEKERRLAQERDRVQRERIVREKVAASTFSRGYLSGIISSVFDKLQASGHFYDPVLREVEHSFMPWLQEQAVEYLSQGVLTRQVVRKLVEAATVQVEINRKEATENLRLREASAAAWLKRQEEAAAALLSAETTRQAQLGEYVLTQMEPRLVTDEEIDVVRTEMTEARAAKAEAEHEEARASAGEKARAEAEAKMAEVAAALEEEKMTAAAAASERGEELPEDWAPEGGAPDPIDVEAMVTAAMDAVVKPDPVPVTVDDILCTMLEKGQVTKDAIMQAMAVDTLGEEAWFRSEAFTMPPSLPPPEPVHAPKARR